MFKVPEKYRVKEGLFGSTKEMGNEGAFDFGNGMIAIASAGMGWEHVSVSRIERTPTWEEMAQVKSLFWDDSDLVIQIHPPKESYINNHEHCLHLWRKAGTNDFVETPPSILVGI